MTIVPSPPKDRRGAAARPERDVLVEVALSQEAAASDDYRLYMIAEQSRHKLPDSARPDADVNLMRQ